MDMPKGRWIDRTLWLTELAFEILEPYRLLLRVLSGSMLGGDPTTSPLHNENSQRAANEVFRRAVVEAKDSPSSRQTKAYTELAYMAHLGLILFWASDQSPGLAATRKLMKQAASMAPLLALGLRMPGVGKQVRELGSTLMAGLKGEAP